MTTNDNYIPVKGDRIRRDWWNKAEYIDVEYVGRALIVGTDDEGEEVSTTIGASSPQTWIKVEPPPVPLPSGWYAVTPYRPSGVKHASAQQALDWDPIQGPVLAAVSFHIDENGDYQAEIIRSTPTQGESS